MTITPSFFATGVDRYCLKMRLNHDGGTGPADDDLVITNTVLLAQMVEGPLRDLFNVSGLTLAQARALITESCHFELIAFAIDLASGAPGRSWSFEVEVTTEAGRPSLAVQGDPSNPNYNLQLAYRHSTGR